MNEKELNRCKKFLDFFGVDYEKDTIYLTDGGNSIICNQNTEWEGFLGHSINGVAEAVAKELGKQTKWK